MVRFKLTSPLQVSLGLRLRHKKQLEYDIYPRIKPPVKEKVRKAIGQHRCVTTFSSWSANWICRESGNSLFNKPGSAVVAIYQAAEIPKIRQQCCSGHPNGKSLAKSLQIACLEYIHIYIHLYRLVGRFNRFARRMVFPARRRVISRVGTCHLYAWHRKYGELQSLDFSDSNLYCRLYSVTRVTGHVVLG